MSKDRISMGKILQTGRSGPVCLGQTGTGAGCQKFRPVPSMLGTTLALFIYFVDYCFFLDFCHSLFYSNIKLMSNQFSIDNYAVLSSTVLAVLEKKSYTEIRFPRKTCYCQGRKMMNFHHFCPQLHTTIGARSQCTGLLFEPISIGT